ncbi:MULTISPECIES: DUF4398 domain-containing protein [Methylocaldum]|jgi:hypothetical protein|uniref:DUF4398 domain-containing protein n=1 Tax=unclassified Methylocaldum TaxID=2622260 RepID=UPI00111C56FE|nr:MULTISPECIES: DUF4398 domain-containing protein [unclassified Methylocaldum]MBP1151886.1 Sec-independent protein translocase protein TatA [Methylocaldum sp. RMAD-M]MVF22437.1 DUF4398 domain-containing protein [Methylocaldum sp. BRCS4]
MADAPDYRIGEHLTLGLSTGNKSSSESRNSHVTGGFLMRIYKAFSKPRPGISIVCLSAMGLFGCASETPPINTISTADTALNQAMMVKASEYAPAEIQRAMDKLGRAKKALADEKYEDARRLAEQAQIDAQLAEAKAQSENARQMAQQAQQTIEELRREAETRGRRTDDVNL